MISRNGADDLFAAAFDISCTGKQDVLGVTDIGRGCLLLSCFSDIAGASIIGTEGKELVTGVSFQ